MKTKEELSALKAEVETLNKKLAELSEDELKLVVGGIAHFEQTSGSLVIDGKLHTTELIFPANDNTLPWCTPVD